MTKLAYILTIPLGLHCIPFPKAEEDGGSSSASQNASNSRRRRAIDPDKVDEEYCVVIKPAPPTPAPTLGPGVYEPVKPVYTEDSLNYTFDISKSKCLFWNETAEKFESNGCYVRMTIRLTETMQFSRR